MHSILNIFKIKFLTIGLSLLLSMQLVLNANYRNPIDKIDSLVQSYESNNLNDSLKVELAYKIANLNVHFDPNLGSEYANKGIELSKKINNNQLLAKMYEAKGSALISLNRFNLAIAAFQNSANIYSNIGDEKKEASEYNNIAYIYFMNKNYEQAVHYYKKSLKYKIKYDDSRGVLLNYSSIAKIYFKAEQYDSTEVYLDIVDNLNMNYEKNDESNINDIIFRNNLLKVKLSLAKDNYQNAKNILNNDSNIVNIINNPLSKIEYYHLFTNLSELLEEHSNALKYLKMKLQIKDSIDNAKKDNITKIVESRTNKIINLKNKEITKVESKFSNMLIYITIFIGLILLISIVIISKKYRENKKLNKVLEEKNHQLIDALEEVKTLVNELTKKKQEIELTNTELSAYNSELEKAKEELEILNKNKNNFFSIIAHDLKTPINGFLSLTKMALNESNDITYSELKEINNILYTSAKNLSNLLENLLLWARSQSGRIVYEPTKVNLYTLVEEILDLHKPIADTKKIRLFHAVPENTFIVADPNQLNSIIRNLITNAIKFSNNEGLVSVKYLEDLMYRKISIEDYGIGMDEETQNKLFNLNEIITRAGTNNEPGTGLGLTICKEFIKAHNGKLDVVSELGQGTTFYISLPKN